jgi:integrase
MSLKGTTYKRCGCKDPGTGKPLNQHCPQLAKRRHGTWMFDTRIDTTQADKRRLKRGGHATETAAADALDQVRDLVKLAGADDRQRRRIGDMIFEKTKRGGQLPAIEDVKRRLGLGRALDTSETFGEAWAAWLAGRRKARPSYARSLDQIGRNWLLPVLSDTALDRISGESCAQVFQRITMFNEEIETAREEGRKPALPGDVRERPKHVGVATQHRIYAALRGFLNYQWKRAHKIPFNPVYAVELEPETRDAPLVWDPAQVVHFLDFHADDRLIALWRFVLLRGFRRGEMCGLADADVDLDAAAVTVNVALLQIGGTLVWGRPKSKAGERVVGLDSGSVEEYRAHRTRRKREKLAAGEAWQESGRAFTREDGTALHPEYVSRRFRQLAKEAGLPVIKFHAARHTSATLALEAGTKTKIVSEQLGHSTTRITEDLYQHVRVQVQTDAAEQIVNLLESTKRNHRETGS